MYTLSACLVTRVCLNLHLLLFLILQNIPKCHSCPAVILCEDFIKEDSPSPPPTKNISLKKTLKTDEENIHQDPTAMSLG